MHLFLQEMWYSSIKLDWEVILNDWIQKVLQFDTLPSAMQLEEPFCNVQETEFAGASVRKQLGLKPTDSVDGD